MQPQPVGHHHIQNETSESTNSHKVSIPASNQVTPEESPTPDVIESGFSGGQYTGPTSSYTFLRKAWKRFSHDGTHTKDLAQRASEDLLSSEHASIFTFGDRAAPPMDLDDFKLPVRKIGFSLLDQYFDLAMPTYRFFHQQTVLQWLEAYYQQQELGVNREHLLPVRQVSSIAGAILQDDLHLISSRQPCF